MMDTHTREFARIVRQEIDAALAELRRELVPTTPPRPVLTEPSSKYLGTQAAADYLGVSRKHLYNLRYAGEGPRARKHGRLIKYVREDLDAWIEERLV